MPFERKIEKNNKGTGRVAIPPRVMDVLDIMCGDIVLVDVVEGESPWYTKEIRIRKKKA